MYADVFWDLKIYGFEGSCIYKLQFVSVSTFGGLPTPPPPPPPPPIPKSWLRYCPSLQKWLPFSFLFCCLPVSLFRRKMRTLFRWGFFFLAGKGGGGGGGGLSAQMFSAPLRKQIKWRGKWNMSIMGMYADIGLVFSNLKCYRALGPGPILNYPSAHPYPISGLNGPHPFPIRGMYWLNLICCSRISCLFKHLLVTIKYYDVCDNG